MNILTDRRITSLFLKISLCILLSAFFSAAFAVFLKKNAGICILLDSFFFGFGILLLLFRYFQEENKRMENAMMQIAEAISGNQDVRLACEEEGEIYRLFHEVNSLVSILNAHAEKERKAKRFLKDTISDISHQLKTPLAALNIYNGILQEEAKELPQVREFTALSEQELDRIETLVQNLLKITKLDAGTIVLEKAVENVAELMDGIGKSFDYRARMEGKNLQISGDDTVTLSCDRIWLTEAVSNIVKNALDHTKRGDSIFVTWKAFASVLQITIEDNGCGIHPEDLFHIFKRFYRSRFSKDTQGVGLGLPLAKAIVEAHNGTIEVKSALGVGSTFLLNFLIPTKL